jgi:uncharacterized membrane protein
MPPRRAHLHLPRTFAEHAADVVVGALGSWRFILIQTAIVLVWVALNTIGWFAWHWDAYPFILLNLAFSTQAAYASPLILMASNRAAGRDRRRDDLEAQEVADIAAMLAQVQRQVAAFVQDWQAQSARLEAPTDRPGE